jgi:hypothetical protein
VAGFFINHEAAPRRAALGLVVLFATFVVGGAGAEANGGAKYDFRVFPSVGTPTTTFRVSFTAPFRTNEDRSYFLEAVGPRGCPSIFASTGRRIRPGDGVVFELTPSKLDYSGDRRRWCRGSYIGFVTWDVERLIGYFRFGVGRAPVSLEP